MGHFFIKTLKNCLKISLSYMSRLSIINFIRENVIEGLTLAPFNFSYECKLHQIEVQESPGVHISVKN